MHELTGDELPFGVSPSDLIEVLEDEDGRPVGGVTRSSLCAEAAEYERWGNRSEAGRIRVALARSRRDPRALVRALDEGWIGDPRLGDGDGYVRTVWVVPRAPMTRRKIPMTLRRPGRPRSRRARRSSSRASPSRPRRQADDDLAASASGWAR
jgi:hypothetical protein